MKKLHKFLILPMIGVLASCSWFKPGEDVFSKVRAIKLNQMVETAIQGYSYYVMNTKIARTNALYEKQEDGSYIYVSGTTNHEYYWLKAGLFCYYPSCFVDLRFTLNATDTYNDAETIFTVEDNEYGDAWFTNFPPEGKYELSPTLLASLARRAVISRCSSIFAGVPTIFLNNVELPESEVAKTNGKFVLNVDESVPGTISITYAGEPIKITDPDGIVSYIDEFSMNYQLYLTCCL